MWYYRSIEPWLKVISLCLFAKALGVAGSVVLRRVFLRSAGTLWRQKTRMAYPSHERMPKTHRARPGSAPSEPITTSAPVICSATAYLGTHDLVFRLASPGQSR